MTFDPNTPNAGQSPGLFPAQSNTNFARLKTIINAEHVFNDTTSATDGVHRQMTTVNRADPVTLIPGTNAILYTKTSGGASQLFFYNGANIQQITPFAQIIKAMVNFNGIPGSPVIRSQTNVTTVTKNGTGDYTITFGTPIANDNYVVQITGMRNSSGTGSFGCVAGDSTYTNSVKVGSLRVNFFNTQSTLTDAFMANIVVLSSV